MGPMTTTTTPLQGLNLRLCKSSTIIIEKAIVFAELVLTTPRIYFPLKNGWIDPAWIYVDIDMVNSTIILSQNLKIYVDYMSH